MADVTFTATAIKPAAGTQKRRVTFGATITPGKVFIWTVATISTRLPTAPMRRRTR